MTTHRPPPSLWQKFHFLLFIIGGFGIIIFGLVYYLSPTTRLQLYGVKLDHRVALRKPAGYLLGWKSQFDSWTERGGRLDTPLGNETTEEISTMAIERMHGTPTQNTLLAKPNEWIRSLKNADGYKNQTLLVTDPSIAEGLVYLDKQGTLLERRPAGWRVARAMQFLFPKFPKGALRPGSTWMEHIEWTEADGPWTLAWQADLHWTLKDVEVLYEKPCARLVYEAKLQPSVLEAPTWTQGASADVHFTSEGDGEALYDVQEKYLISNTFSYGAVIKMHIPDLDKVPEELRIGQVTTASDGDVVIKMSNKMDVRLP